ncbi:uncharacterized protein LOC107851792 [Capsicum annuum]|uniref:uncharacterized protein LOC107851792 n=1 Tax=Capsicum annuum TaxID=4072 RepID=UPI0007BF7625|nr:uncharacterized protein LOC107851792 [Capsicum annuum]
MEQKQLNGKLSLLTGRKKSDKAETHKSSSGDRLALRRLGHPPLIHCFREQNQVVDSLAKEGAKRKFLESIQIFAVPPVYALDSVWIDILGTQFIRKNNSELISHDAYYLEPD